MRIFLFSGFFLVINFSCWARVVISYPDYPFYPPTLTGGRPMVNQQLIDIDEDGVMDLSYTGRAFTNIDSYLPIACPDGGQIFNAADEVIYHIEPASTGNGRFYSTYYGNGYPPSNYSNNLYTKTSINIIGPGMAFQNILPQSIGYQSRTYTINNPNNPPPLNSYCAYNQPNNWSQSGPMNYESIIDFQWVKNGLIYYGYIQFNYRGIVLVAFENIPGFPIKINDKKGYYSSNDPNFNVIQGSVYVDLNSNCAKDAGERGIPNSIVYSDQGYAGITDINGNYEILIPGGTATYNITADTSFGKSDISIICPISKVLSVDVNGNNKTFTGKNLGVSVPSCTDLQVHIGSNRRRRCFRNYTTVTYSNHGVSSVPGVSVKVVMPSHVKAISSSPAWSSQSGDTLFYSIGTLSPLTIGKINITDSVICGDETIRGMTVCTKAYISPMSYCYDPGWDLSDITLTGTCHVNEYKIAIKNSGTGPMSDSLDYRIYLDSALIKTTKYRLGAGESCIVNIPASGKTVRVEADQQAYHPELLMRALSFEGCGITGTNVISTGMVNKFPQTPSVLGEAVSCIPILDSYDPNDKQAFPDGVGTANIISKDQEMIFTIRFQNTGTDTAYTVVVADTLNANLNAFSFETIAASHPYKLEMTGLHNPRVVWIFPAINLPDSVTNKEKSQGFVTFKVKMKNGLSNGTKITNRAFIFFDYNSAILTNTVARTIGNPYPDDRFVLNSFISPDTVCEGSSAMFSVIAEGDNIGYTWKKNGDLIPGASNNEYRITFADSSSQGIYTCEISSTMDSAKVIKNFVVRIYPQLLAVPSLVSGCEGESLKTGVKAKGTNINFEWYKDGQLLDGATSDSIFFNSLSSAENGNYYVKIYNTCAYTNSSIFQLETNEKPDLHTLSSAESCPEEPVDLSLHYEDLSSTSGNYTYYKDMINGTQAGNPVTDLATYYIVKISEKGCSDTTSILVVEGNCSVNGLDKNRLAGIKIYPNPASDYLVIESENPHQIKVKLLDLHGQLIYSTEFTSKAKIDLSGLPSGSYLVNISLGEKSSVYTVLKP